MNIEEVLKEIDFVSEAYDCEFGLPLDNETYLNKLTDIVSRFGKQCFEAGRKIIPFPNPNIDYAIVDPTDWEEYKFKTFEEYLKSLYER